MSVSLITGLITFITGTTFTLMAMNLPAAPLGRANEPKIFPISLGVLMILLSLVLIGQEMKKKSSKDNAEYEKAVFKIDNHIKNIVLTVLNAIIYAFLFVRVGYVISTFFFVGLELLLFSGLKKWKSSALIALVFSLTIYILFYKLLGVYLPMTPYIWI
ncbi:MAG: tripartite tricarboxylate transporter TctB family protein [Spirochaetaceae bacterium]|nr:tripartite tricarboxylate transporter TctB family protein [Spirochaetaceae bacterium]